jgi:hypothetical protein
VCCYLYASLIMIFDFPHFSFMNSVNNWPFWFPSLSFMPFINCYSEIHWHAFPHQPLISS